MKKLLPAAVALVALGATVPALAADLPARTYTKAPAYVAPLYNWTGFYIGGHIGGAFSGNNNFGGLVTGNNNDGRFLGGLQAGADYQFAPNWVIGAELQYSWLGSTTTASSSRAASSTPITSARSARRPAASATPGVRACST